MQSTRIALLLLAAVIGTMAACSGGGGNSGSVVGTAVPQEVSDSGGPDAYTGADLTMSAADLLRRSDEAMLALDFVRVFSSDDREECFGLSELVEPGYLQRLTAVCIRVIGGVRTYSEESDSPSPPYESEDTFYRSVGRPRAYNPDSDDTSAQDVRVIGTASIDGRDAWVIWYWKAFASFEGPFRLWYTEWIDRETFWLVRQTTTSDDPLGSALGPSIVLYDFNEPSRPPRYPVAVPAAEPRRLVRTLVVPAREDVSISQADPTMNLEGEPLLEAEGAPWLRTLVSFDVPDLPGGAEVLSASLGLFVLELPSSDASSQRLGTVHAVDEDWDAASVTWDDAPEVGERLAELMSSLEDPGTPPRDVTGSWLHADVSDVVAPGVNDFYVIHEADPSGIEFAASEGSNGPVMVVTYEYAAEPIVPFTQ